MSPRTSSKSNIQSNARPSGLILCGSVIDRTRRMVPKDNPTTEIVTYTVQDDNNRKYFVDDYAPEGYHELGEIVELRVYIKPYLRKNGETSYTINVQKMGALRGEHF